jgi:hypothetical protein
LLALALSLAFAPLEILDLEVDGPACVDEEAVLEAAARYLGRSDIDQLDTKVLARVEVRETQAAYTVRIAVELPPPHAPTDRLVDAMDCAEAVDIAGLIISVALDPVAVSREVEPKGEAASESEVEPGTTPDTSTDDTVAPPAPPSPLPAKDARRFDLRALGLLGFGQFERVAGGLELGLDYGRDLWRIGAFGRYWLPQKVEVEDSPDVGIRLQSAMGGVSACVVPSHGRWRFASCGVVEGGILSARGFGLERNEGTRLPLFAIGAQQLVSFELHPRFSLDFVIGSAVHFIRPRVEIDDLGVIFSRGAVAFRAAFGPSLRF